MMKFIKFNQQAFTILELMIATMVFSVILLLVTTGILQIGKTYYKGALQARTQGAARNIIDEVSRGIQFSGETVAFTTPLNAAATPYPQPGGKYGFCVNGVGYAYIIDRQLARSPSGSDQVSKTLISYGTPCAGFTAQDVATVSGRELLGIGMRLTALNVQSLGNNTFAVTVEVASGEPDLFSDLYKNIDGSVGTDGIFDTCKTGTGKEFCAISRLTTTVQKRVL